VGPGPVLPEALTAGRRGGVDLAEIFRTHGEAFRRTHRLNRAQPFAGPEQVLQYLGRYTHRVALSNERLVDLQNGVVRFRWKDYSDGDRMKVMALAAEEFVRRFLLHIVPERFVRIRHFGVLANRSRQAKLARCRQLLGQPLPPPPPTAESVPALLLRLTGIDIERCQVCGQGRLAAVEMLRPTRPIPVRAPDTS
jgi:hypothetical protein